MKNYFAFDVGGTDIKYGIVNEEGKILKKNSYPSPKNIDEFVEKITDIVLGSKEKVEGIALSMPGAVDSNSGIIGGSSALPFIHGPNFKELLKGKTSLDVELENDANCAALAESWVGIARDKKDILFLVIGTGIGGAIIKDSKIHRGNNLHGGEFGYMISDIIDGEPHTLSYTASTSRLVARVAHRLERDKSSLNGIKVFELYEEGVEVVVEEVEYFYNKLAEAIYNLQYSFDPELIVLGGSISSRETLAEEISFRVDKLLKKFPFATLRPNIRRCKYMGDANLLGAVRHYIQKQED